MLQVQNLTVRYDGQNAVSGVSFSLREGQWLMLAGPNGAGKSTLIHAISQSVRYDGSILLDGKNIRTLRPSALARKIGVLSQHNHVSYAYTVGEIVDLGRYAHSRGFLSRQDAHGEALVAHALEATGMTEMRHKSVLELSGGEVQRAFLAQIFAQDPQILILDEPANHLDLIYQKHIFTLIQEWLQQPGRAVLSVVHDLSLAMKYGTHALLMDKGKCISQGETHAVLSPENLRTVYGMDVHGWMQELLKQWQN